MSDVVTPPRVRCDNCNKVEEKVKETYEKEWKRPRSWGRISIDPTNLGHVYPNHIVMTDLCETCLRKVHHAVGEALQEAREIKGKST